MLEVRTNVETKTTKAIVPNPEHDAVKRILKKMPELKSLGVKADDVTEKSHDFELATALIKNEISGTVTCRPEDEFSAEVGENEAVKKAMKNHKNAFNRALKHWQAKMILRIKEVNPETFKDALAEAEFLSK